MNIEKKGRKTGHSFSRLFALSRQSGSKSPHPREIDDQLSSENGPTHVPVAAGLQRRGIRKPCGFVPAIRRQHQNSSHVFDSSQLQNSGHVFDSANFKAAAMSSFLFRGLSTCPAVVDHFPARRLARFGIAGRLYDQHKTHILVSPCPSIGLFPV